MKPFAIMVLMVLPTAPGVYAADCATTFDQACLSREYKPEEITVQHDQRAQELKAFEKAAQEQEARGIEEDALAAEAAAQRAEKERQEWIEERRHLEQLGAQHDIADAIRNQRPTVIVEPGR